MEHLRRARRLACLCLSLKLQDGANIRKGWVRAQHGDEGNLLLKLFPETNEESVDEGPIVDVVAKFTQLVANGLDALAVDGDRRVALAAGAELDVERVNTRIGVVLEELLQGGP